MIRVCIADDQALIRSGLKALLELFEGISICAEAADGEAALSVVAQEAPDVLLLDVRMPKLTGVEVVRTLSARGCLPPTLLLTTFADDTALVAGVRAGARGFLLKGVTAEILVDAIRTVAAGGAYLFAPLAEDMDNRSAADWRADALDTPDPLTPRESQVLRLMTSGISNREIAQALRLGEGTVRNHVSSILSKLGVSDRTRAILRALEQRLV